MPEVIISQNFIEPQPSRASSPMGSTRKRPQAANRKASIADDISSVNGEKKEVKRSATTKQGAIVDPVIDPIFQPRGLIPQIFNYNDALSEN